MIKNRKSYLNYEMSEQNINIVAEFSSRTHTVHEMSRSRIAYLGWPLLYKLRTGVGSILVFKIP